MLRFRNRLELLLVNRNERALAMGLRRFKEEDVFRLMTLEVWSLRYKVSLDWVLNILLNYWRTRYRKEAFETQGFGTKIPAFVGSHSELILKEKILQIFPGRENEQDWRDSEKRRLIRLAFEVPNGKKRYEDPLAYVKRYREIMAQANQMEDLTAQSLSKRKFRGNPWT